MSEKYEAKNGVTLSRGEKFEMKPYCLIIKLDHVA